MATRPRHAFHQIDLLVGSRGQLIVVRVIEGFRERVAHVVLVADAPKLGGTMLDTNEQSVVPGLGL
jgi:hypothetical protein